MERLSRAEDGRIAWRMKRPLPDGTTHLLFTGLEFLRRVASQAGGSIVAEGTPQEVARLKTATGRVLNSAEEPARRVARSR
ncbi:hypothetical protein NR798_26600 [Archangium gephyra]|uniref:hypothetical protein n=1 Tax=Archangium gephyra TaxID=48 RepID=UPI0035D4369F